MINQKKIILGTAQFGSHYGITNKVGEVKCSEVSKIIEEANNNGVNFFDTAPIYGNAEKKLGKSKTPKLPQIEFPLKNEKYLNIKFKSIHPKLRKFHICSAGLPLDLP